MPLEYQHVQHNRIFDALHAAADDAERLALLASLSGDELASLSAELAYWRLFTESAAAVAATDAGFAAFTESLGQAADDTGRLKIIEAARSEHDSAWLAEWAWRRTASEQDWIERYMRMIL